jgi:hypothetical protein
MATYYWVGGNGTWDTTTKTNWASSSGGGGGVAAPTSADSVIFDLNSGASPVVTISSAVCSACTIGAPTSGTLTLGFGASTLTMAGNMSITTSISVTGTGTINLSSASATFAGNGNTFYNVAFTSTAITTASITGANTYNNLTFSTRAATGLSQISIGANQTVNAILTLGSGTTGVIRNMYRSDTLGTQRTITAATLAAASDIDFRDINAAGASSPWSGTRFGDCKGNNTSTITFPTGVNKYWNFAAGGAWYGAVWALSSGAGVATTNFPLAQDTAVIEDANLNSGASINLGLTWNMSSINFSGRTLPVTFNTQSTNQLIYGNFTLSSAVTFSSAGSYTFLGQGVTQNITSGGASFLPQTIINNINGTFKLIDNLSITSPSAVTLTSGTLDLNGKTLTAASFAFNSTFTRVIAFGTGNITLTGSGTIWNTTTITNFSYTGTPTVNISNNSATATTVTTGAMSAAQALNFNYTVGTYTLTDTSAVYKSLNFTGFTGTIPNSARTIYGNLILVSGMTLTAGANATTFAATSGTSTITTAAKTLDFPLTFNGVGGTFAFQDALTQGSTRAFTITNGTVQLKNSVTSTVGSFVANSAAMKYLQSTLAGTQATLSQASGTVNASNLTIRDINATGGAIWNAYYINGDIDAGNNTGWDFLVQLGRYIYTRRKNKVILK